MGLFDSTLETNFTAPTGVIKLEFQSIKIEIPISDN